MFVTAMVQNKYEQSLSQGQIMNSHNTKTDKVVSNELVRIVTDHKGVRVVKSELANASELSIADDFDTGGDPYNSTGQHVVIKSQIDIED